MRDSLGCQLLCLTSVCAPWKCLLQLKWCSAADYWWYCHAGPRRCSTEWPSRSLSPSSLINTLLIGCWEDSSDDWLLWHAALLSDFVEPYWNQSEAIRTALFLITLTKGSSTWNDISVLKIIYTKKQSIIYSHVVILIKLLATSEYKSRYTNWSLYLDFSKGHIFITFLGTFPTLNSCQALYIEKHYNCVNLCT